jgi:hypothetical protein
MLICAAWRVAHALRRQTREEECVIPAVDGVLRVQRLMDGLPGCPKINSGFVDVRDVADLHRRASG